MKINQKIEVEREAKVLKIHLKCCDGFSAQLVDQHGAEIKDYEGYVPGFMPGEHYGDYVILNIDIDTGMVLNWKQPSQAQIEEFIGGNDE